MRVLKAFYLKRLKKTYDNTVYQPTRTLIVPYKSIADNLPFKPIENMKTNSSQMLRISFVYKLIDSLVH